MYHGQEGVYRESDNGCRVADARERDQKPEQGYRRYRVNKIRESQYRGRAFPVKADQYTQPQPDNGGNRDGYQ